MELRHPLLWLLGQLHLVALGKGSWDLAATLSPIADPLERDGFGGEEAEPDRVYRHDKAMRARRDAHWKARKTRDPKNPN